MTLTLTLEEARRVAVMAQSLDADRPKDLYDAVTRLGRVQMDPTAVVARTEHLVLYSRLGAYDRADLEDLMWKERKLFEYWAFIVPTADLPLYKHTMDRVRLGTSPRNYYLPRWMKDNAAFRQRVLRELARRGPLRSRDIADESTVKYESTGWNGNRNVGRMLDGLWARGEVAIVGREGGERLWGLAKGWYPPGSFKRASDQEVARAVMSRQLATKGIARLKDFGYSFDGRPPGWDKSLADLVREGKAREVRVEGLKHSYYLWTPLLDRKYRGRSAVLSPFDRLIHDRVQARELFGLEYLLEIYVPPAKRRWGYFVLPVLDGDRFVARFDARREPETGTFRVLALHAEPGVRPDSARVVAREVRSLARWLGLPNVSYDRVPRGWRKGLES
ncbi:MAG: winged helix DNA-binding domain-containing protein [Chloroflexota bacterium]|nr:winged helix DNA-binding domain-containing protein [Chloroflexota bacterium]